MAEDMDWNTLSLKGSSTISQRSMKEISVSTAIELGDINLLRAAAQGKDGLVDAQYRGQAWQLLQSQITNLNDKTQYEEWPIHRDEEQVKLDVNRSFVYYPLLVNEKEKEALRTKLQRMLIRLLRRNPQLSYYQGLHDVCSVILLVIIDEAQSYQFFERFALLHLRDFMMPNLNSSLETLRIIPELLKKIDPGLYDDLELSTMNPFFCLSPIITLFSHDLRTLGSLSLVFDQIISYGSMIVVYYIYVTLLIQKKGTLLEKINNEGDDCFTKADRIHSSLSKFLDDINYDDINGAILVLPQMFKSYPAQKLESVLALNPYSVLKTTSKIENRELDLSLADLLSKQIQDSKKVKLRKAHQASTLLKLFSSKNNQQVFKWTVTVGILSLVINILLNRNRGLFSQHLSTFAPQIWNAGLGVSKQVKDYLSK